MILGGRGWGRQGKGISISTILKGAILRKCVNTFVPHCSNRDGEVRARDHCHITGKYRGSARQDCNLKLCISVETFKLSVIFHSLRGYDSHFVMQEIGAIGKNNNLEINCIPNSMEKYMAFMLGNHLVFLDVFNLWLVVWRDWQTT